MTAPAEIAQVAKSKPPQGVGLGPVLSPRQWECLAAYAETGDQRIAAERVGVRYRTYKNHLVFAYDRLDVRTAVDAFRVLGWLRVPELRGAA